MRRSIRSLVGRRVAAALAVLLLGTAVAAGAQDRSALPGGPQIDLQTERKLAFAEGHHDLAVLLIKKGEIDKGVAHARAILQLRLGGEFEKLWVQSLSIICERLAEVRRFDAGQVLLDEALKAAEQNVNRVKILRNKARLYVLAGDNDRAIESWSRALEIESPRNR